MFKEKKNVDTDLSTQQLKTRSSFGASVGCYSHEAFFVWVRRRPKLLAFRTSRGFPEETKIHKAVWKVFAFNLDGGETFDV